MDAQHNEGELELLRSRAAKLDQVQLDLANERDTQITTQRRIGALQTDLNKALSELSSLKGDLEAKTAELSSTQEECSHLSTKLKGYPALSLSPFRGVSHGFDG
jgi:hypothetical protein